MSIEETALAYAAKGYPVFPIEPKGKRPLARLAPHGFKDATCELDRVKAWWKDAADANIGIPTGIVFDVADLDSEAAMKRFLAVAKEHDTEARAFPRARTGGGGRHVLVAPTGVGNRAGVMPEMDWRGIGGYIVAPGSIHASGEKYEWITEPNGTLPPCPPWLLALLDPPKDNPPKYQPTAAPQAYVEAAMDAELRELRGAPLGQRNDQLNRSAFALGQMVGAGWLDHGRAEAELRAAAHAIDHGHEPGLTATLKSGLDSGARDPRQAPVGGFGATSAGEIRKGSSTPPTRQHEPVGDVTVRSLAELRALPEAETNWVVYRFLATTAITDLSAFIKTGKSTLSAQLMASICHGTEFLEEFPAVKGKVVLLTEEGISTLVEAFDDAGLTDADPLQILLWTENEQLPWAKAVEGAVDLCHLIGAKTLIVDTLGQWAQVEDENDASMARQAMGPLLQAAASGLAVAMLRQSRKTGGEIHNAGRGSGAFGGAASILLHLDYVRAENGRFDDSSTLRTLTLKSRLEREQVLPMKLDYADGKYRLVDRPGRIFGQPSVADRILSALRIHGRIQARDLVSALGIPKGSRGPNIMRLTEKGLIRIQNGFYELSDTYPGYMPDTSDTSGDADTGTPPLKGVVIPDVSARDTSDTEAGLNTTPPRVHRTTCPDCGKKPYSHGPDGAPQRRCHGCGATWTPGTPWPSPNRLQPTEPDE